MSRRLVRTALALAAPVLALLVLKVFFCDVYRVDSGSMEPTLHGDPEEGELVLVRYASAPRPERFDLVVLRREGVRAPFIKRVVGLPGERIQLLDGDLLVNGARLPAATARPATVPLFDELRQSFADEFLFSDELWSKTPEGWRLDNPKTLEGWVLDNAEPEALPEHGLALYRHPATDAYPAADGAQAPGLRDVGDVVLECDVRLETPEGLLTWSVTEGGERFVARLEGGEVSLVRTGQGAEVVLAHGQLTAPSSGWRHVRLANVDGTVSFELGGPGGLYLEAAYQSDSVPQNRREAGYRHLFPRACLGGGTVRARFRAVRLSRDLHYTELGSHGQAQALELGPDEVFVLGDNSGDSTDSREWGAVRLEQLFGFAEAVVWPPSGMRRLRTVRSVVPAVARTGN